MVMSSLTLPTSYISVSSCRQLEQSKLTCPAFRLKAYQFVGQFTGLSAHSIDADLVRFCFLGILYRLFRSLVGQLLSQVCKLCLLLLFCQ